jgi:hypothetical protein
MFENERNGSRTCLPWLVADYFEIAGQYMGIVIMHAT